MKGDKLVIQEGHIKAAHSLFHVLLPYMKDNEGIFIITIAGESGSGKSEIAVVLAQLFSEKQGIRSIIIQQDDYFVYPPKTNAMMRRKNIGHIGVSEVRLNLLDQNLKDVLEGKDKIEKPLVIFDDDRITEETIALEGMNVVIVEGTYTTLLKNVHQHIFIDRTYRDTRASRKQRAREEQDEFLEKILEIEHEIISSHKQQANIIVDNNYDVRRHGEKR